MLTYFCECVFRSLMLCIHQTSLNNYLHIKLAKRYWSQKAPSPLSHISCRSPFDKLPSPKSIQYMSNNRGEILIISRKALVVYILTFRITELYWWLSTIGRRTYWAPSKSSTMQADNYFVIYILMNTEPYQTHFLISNANMHWPTYRKSLSIFCLFLADDVWCDLMTIVFFDAYFARSMGI